MDSTTTMIAGLSILFVVLAFGGFLVALWVYLNQEPTQIEQRLAFYSQDSRTKIKQVTAADELYQWLMGLGEPLAKKFYQNKKSLHGKLYKQLGQAGFPTTDKAVWKFLTFKVLFSILFSSIVTVLVFLCSLLFYPFQQALYYGFTVLVASVLLSQFLPDFILKEIGIRRRTAIYRSVADVVDLMVVCVEAGLGLESCLQRVSDESRTMCPELSEELNRTVNEINAGIPRSEALENLGIRTNVDDLRSLTTLLVQSDKMGTSIANTLRVYAEDNRTRRKQRAEELASKASTKMTIPLVMFILPAIMVVMVGPSVINMLEYFGNSEAVAEE